MSTNTLERCSNTRCSSFHSFIQSAEAAGFNVLPNAGECTRPTPASTSDSEPEGDEESASESSTLLVSLSAIAWIGAVVAMLVLI